MKYTKKTKVGSKIKKKSRKTTHNERGKIQYSSINKSLVHTHNPVIGILTTPLNKNMHKFAYSYLPQSYVKWIEMSGGRVVPIQYNISINKLKIILNNINGVLFIGGSINDRKISKPENNAYIKTAKYILEYAKTQNIKKNYYPLFGICLGHEVLGILNISKSVDIIRSKFTNQEIISLAPREGETTFNLDTTINSQLLKSKIYTRHELNKFKQTPVAYMHHKFGFRIDMPYIKKLQSYLTILAKDQDVNGRSYIAAYEYNKYPFYGVQFHPEKSIFEWKKGNIKHSRYAQILSRKLSRFFISECSKNTNTWNTVYDNLLIYNYTLYSQNDIIKLLKYNNITNNYYNNSFESVYFF